MFTFEGRQHFVMLLTALCLMTGPASAGSPDQRNASVPHQAYGIGTPATKAETTGWNITIGPEGKNLPPGQGTVAAGKTLYDQSCSSCHGAKGQGGVGPRLAGGIGTLATAQPIKDVGSYWPFATTLFDYIRRTMPFNHPESLSNSQVYAASAYILYLNHIIPSNAVMDKATLPKVVMPNRHGFLWQSDNNPG